MITWWKEQKITCWYKSWQGKSKRREGWRAKEAASPSPGREQEEYVKKEAIATKAKNVNCWIGLLSPLLGLEGIYSMVGFVLPYLLREHAGDLLTKVDWRNLSEGSGRLNEDKHHPREIAYERFSDDLSCWHVSKSEKI